MMILTKLKQYFTVIKCGEAWSMRLCHQLCSENIDRIWADAQSIIRYFYDLFTRRYPERLFKTVYAVRAFSRKRINVHSRSKLSVAAYLYIYLPVGEVIVMLSAE